MSDKEYSREDVQRELDVCESRLHELVKAEKGEHDDELDELGAELKSCKLELGKLENRSEDEWQDAKHSVVQRLSQVRRSLDSSARRMV